jgi:spore coat polysaccharide biosynthesis protein SpsF (cytidylyltransferase family)
MRAAAIQHEVQTIIRVCHDKLWVDPDTVEEALEEFNVRQGDYLYSNKFMPGTGFEIISYDCLDRAVRKFVTAEHISYACKATSSNTLLFDPPAISKGKARLLIDYPEDLTVIETILQRLGNDCTLDEVKHLVKNAPWIMNINRQPLVTVYTCAHQADKYIDQAIKSVLNQHVKGEIEYLLIDDYSTDQTPYIMAKYLSKYPDIIRYSRNSENVGLSSSSNRALSMAKGKYIIRLDADDYFTSGDSVQTLITKLEEKKADAIYPNYYYGEFGRLGYGRQHHHAACALFRTRALNHIRFTEELRGHDSLDVFLRAKDQLKIAYTSKVAFFYRQHSASLTKNNLDERDKIKKDLIDKHEGTQL